MGVISNEIEALKCERDGAVPLHLGVISNALASLDDHWLVQSPFIWG